MPTARMAAHDKDTNAKSMIMVGLVMEAPLRKRDLKRL